VVAAGDRSFSLEDWVNMLRAGYRRKRREILRRCAPQDDGEKLGGPSDRGEQFTNRAEEFIES